MKIVPFVYGAKDDIIANTYLIIDEDNKAMIVDPSVDYDGVIHYLEKENAIPQGILITHGHFDHIRGVKRTAEHFQIPVYISFLDEELLHNPELNCSYGSVHGEVTIDGIITRIIGEKDSIPGLSEAIQVIETPYHTEGSVCYYLKNSRILFSGDSLFRRSIGRDDLPSSVSAKRRESLAKLMRLPDDVIVYPGHGKATSIGEEREFNPFINR